MPVFKKTFMKMVVAKQLPFVLCGALFAATSAFAADLNIAFLDVERAILGTEEAKRFNEALEKELRADIETVKKLNKQVQELEEKLIKDEDILSETERRRMLSDMRAKRLQREGQARLLQQVQQARQTALFERVAPDLQAIMDDLIAIENYDAVLRKDEQALYVNPVHDITRKVTERLNDLK